MNAFTWVPYRGGAVYATPARISDRGTPPAALGASLGQTQYDIEGLIKGITEIIGKLPSNVAGQYRADLDECKAKVADGGLLGLVTGGKCLYDLFQDVKDALRREEERPVPVPIGTTPSPEPDGISPVVILGGAALLAALGYVVFVRPKS